MTHRHDPGPSDRIMVLRHIEPVTAKECQQGLLHQLVSCVRVMVNEVNVSQPDMGAMVEFAGRKPARLELRAKVLVACRCLVFHDCALSIGIQVTLNTNTPATTKAP